jgi:hypothetical protein
VAFSSQKDVIAAAAAVNPTTVNITLHSLVTKKSETKTWKDFPFKIDMSRLDCYEMDIGNGFVFLKCPFISNYLLPIRGGRKLAVAKFDGDRLTTVWHGRDDSFWSVATDSHVIRYHHCFL